MNVRQAHEYLGNLIRAGLGDLEMYTEYQRVSSMRAGGAEEGRDGSQTELKDNEPFVYVELDH